MSEYFDGAEGDWVRGKPLSESWNLGHWRKVDNATTHYKDGLAFDMVDGKTYTYTTVGSRRSDNYWERFVPVVKVPIEPGLYRDKEGDLWTYAAGLWMVFMPEDGYWEPSNVESAEEFLPFELVAKLKEEK